MPSRDDTRHGVAAATIGKETRRENVHPSSPTIRKPTQIPKKQSSSTHQDTRLGSASRSRQLITIKQGVQSTSAIPLPLTSVMSGRTTGPGGVVKGRGPRHSRVVALLTPQQPEKPRPESKQSLATIILPKEKKKKQKIKLPADLGNTELFSPELLWSDKGTPFPKQLLTRFKAYGGSCKRVREAKKIQHRIVRYLIHHKRLRPAQVGLHDATGTLSHALLLILAFFEIDQAKLNRPLPPLLEAKVIETQITESEHVTAFAQERRRAVKGDDAVLARSIREPDETSVEERAEHKQSKRPRSAQTLTTATRECE